MASLGWESATHYFEQSWLNFNFKFDTHMPVWINPTHHIARPTTPVQQATWLTLTPQACYRYRYRGPFCCFAQESASLVAVDVHTMSEVAGM